ncbi:MAG: GIY-YIG nuclease family protein [Candidatus Neomarinimicrobiota bacterium]
MYYVYVLKSQSARNWHYIGSCRDPSERMTSHNRGKVRSTKGYRPLELIHKETYPTRSQAYRREMFYKTAKGKAVLKERLLKLGVW